MLFGHNFCQRQMTTRFPLPNFTSRLPTEWLPSKYGRIIETEMRDRALNEQATFPCRCVIEKLCCQAEILPNSLVDRWHEASRI